MNWMLDLSVSPADFIKFMAEIDAGCGIFLSACIGFPTIFGCDLLIGIV